MFADWLDIGLHVEDRQAARVASHAIDHGYQAVFQNARGPFLEVQFVPPPSSEMTSGGEDDIPPLLYGWMEQVPADRIIHLLRTSETRPTTDGAAIRLQDVGETPGHPQQNRRLAADAAIGTDVPTAATSSTEVMEVCGQMNFVLHLWSTPHTERAMQLHKEMHETAEVSHDDGEGSAGRGRDVDSRHEATRRAEEDKHFFNADGKDVVLTDPFERELELRDDTAKVRAAVDTIVTVGRLIKENPSAKLSCFYDDEACAEYIKFE